MNQILLHNKLYVTPELKKQKRRYKIRLIISMILMVILLVYYIYAEHERERQVAVSDQILNQIEINDMTKIASTDNTTKNIVNDVLIVELSGSDADEASSEVIEEVENNEDPTSSVVDSTPERTVTVAGANYTSEAILSIPKLGISYPVLSETSEELLKISLNKYWGGEPNEVGNYCVVGHNYANGKLFGKLKDINIGDTCTLKDMKGRTVTYEVYERYIVDPTDVSCTSQLTNGQVEMTLITCKEYGTKRLVVKCKKI